MNDSEQKILSLLTKLVDRAAENEDRDRQLLKTVQALEEKVNNLKDHQESMELQLKAIQDKRAGLQDLAKSGIELISVIPWQAWGIFAFFLALAMGITNPEELRHIWEIITGGD